MGDALLGQPGEFAVRAASVFLLGRGLAQHRPHALAGVMAPEHGKQLVTIEAIVLGPPCASVHFDAGSINHDVVDALPAQPAVQPPPVAPGLIAGVNLGLRLEAATLPGSTCTVEYGSGVTRVHTIAARAVPTIAGGQLPGFVAELEAYVQFDLDRRILGLWDCLVRGHFRLLRTELEIPF
ncbi:hypothetical protein [Paraburkholderia sp. EG304]|uniref:hypothetical protein n=1 Tax=Paraburkholderia sp. EG304 TaxID=3237015 RepID=UPI00397D7DD8